MSHNQHGLCWLDPEIGAFRELPLDLPEHVDKHMNVGLMKEDPQGNFWLLWKESRTSQIQSVYQGITVVWFTSLQQRCSVIMGWHGNR